MAASPSISPKHDTPELSPPGLFVTSSYLQELAAIPSGASPVGYGEDFQTEADLPGSDSITSCGPFSLSSKLTD